MSSPKLKAPLTRNRYFHGRFLSAEDLSNEQSVIQSGIAQLWARSAWGIVDGLEVSSQDDTLSVSRGQAIDRFGRVLVLADDAQLKIDDETWSGLWGQACKVVWNGSESVEAAPVRDSERYLCLVRWDEWIERVPVLAAEVTDDAGAVLGPDNVPFAYSRIAERVLLCFAPNWAIAADAWFYRGDARPKDRDGAHLELVPLARVTRAYEPAQARHSADVDLSGRPIATHNHRRPSQLADTPEIAGLTRIVATSWIHNGQGAWPEPGLCLTFDAPLGELPPRPAVEVWIERNRTRLAIPELSLELDPNATRLTLLAKAPELQPGDLIRLRINCDFVIDCRGFPIDGAHLRGRLPSGRGLAGDFFESWFWFEESVGGNVQGDVG